MPSIFKHFSRSKAEPYVFPDAEELVLPELEPEDAAPPEPEKPADGTEPAAAADQPEQTEQEPSKAQQTIEYAQLQAEMITADARRQADELLEKARQDAAAEAEQAHKAAESAGYQDGYARGLAQALEEGAAQRQAQAVEQAAEVQRFLEKASAALDRQLDDNVGELRDLALAVAEKVISISLKSSSEVIGRMVQAAIDKRKRREWVHIYISETDARRMGQIPASLSAALAELSDRVRIIPMADDEPGTCVVEMPDEIIDASASTQLNNIRAMLGDAPAGDGGKTRL